MTKTMRKVQVGDTILCHRARAGYWSSLAVGETAVVDRIEESPGGVFISLFDASGRHIFRADRAIRMHVVV
jgi:hypothetical protein